jgi:calcium-dependent protein kinase
VAPEVLTDSYTYKCDIWSIGVITYILLCGFAPFSGENDSETLNLVRTAEAEYPSPEWDDISDVAKDFVKSLLLKDAFMRPTAAEAMDHPWIAKHVAPPGMPQPRPFSPYVSGREESAELRMDGDRSSAFHKFLATIKVNKAMNTIAQVLTPSEAEKVGDAFRRDDENKDGTIDVKGIDDAVETGQFSNSLRGNLLRVRSTVAKIPGVTFDVRSFVAFTDKKKESNNSGPMES